MEPKLMWMVSAVAVVAWVGCGDLELTYAAQGLVGCDDMTCSNSLDLPAQVLASSVALVTPGPVERGGGSPLPPDELGGFHELNLSGVPNRQGIWIKTVNGHAQIGKNNQMYDLKVQHGRLIGLAGTTVLQAEDLVGAEIGFGPRPGESHHTAPRMHIDGVRRFAMPFDQPGDVEVYRITLKALRVPAAPLCAAVDHAQGMESGEVVVFEGDRIDVERKTMGLQPEPDWFNLGCAGSALSKLYFMGETVATQANPLDDASWQERQAMLKMLVADYCGTGLAFTVVGEPLLWQGGRVSYALPPLDLEARWNANGAICLGTPRLAIYPAPTSGFSADIMTDIAARCGERMPPPCANTDLLDYDGAIVVSGNRP